MKEVNLKGHIIICGTNDTALNIVEGLERYHDRHLTRDNTPGSSSHDYIVIDSDEDRLEKISNNYGHFHYLTGDATDDKILLKANIKEAFGIFPVLMQNKDNIFITFTARRINPSIRIVARTSEIYNIEQKLKTAGADAVVSPNFIGGMRMVSELTRPASVEFLDQYLRHRDISMQFNELVIPGNYRGFLKTAGSQLSPGYVRSELGFRVVAVQKSGASNYQYNPADSFKLDEGDTIVVFSNTQQHDQLRNLFNVEE